MSRLPARPDGPRVTDVSKLTLREALELVEPREAYFDLLVGKADWVALSGAVQAAELMLQAVEDLPAAKQAAARKAAQKALDAAHAAYKPHVRRVWFDPTPEYEDLSIKYSGDELRLILLEKCAREPDDERVTADEWRKLIAKWPARDRASLKNTVLYLNIEPTVPDLGKGFSPSR